MPKLHELLAVAKDRRGQVEKIRGDLHNLFNKKPDHFREQIATYNPKAENEASVTETKLSIQTTVASELRWFGNYFADMVDSDLGIATTNCEAKGTITLGDGTVIAEDVPASSLLDLEKRLGEFLALVKAVPTLDPSKGFEADNTRAAGIWKARDATRQRTAKTQRPVVLYPATPEHPAQTQMITEDEVVGTLVISEWSSMLTPTQKAAMLERLEEMRRAVKQARSRANEHEVPKHDFVGAKLMDFILRGELV